MPRNHAPALLHTHWCILSSGCWVTVTPHSFLKCPDCPPQLLDYITSTLQRTRESLEAWNILSGMFCLFPDFFQDNQALSCAFSSPWVSPTRLTHWLGGEKMVPSHTCSCTTASRKQGLACFVHSLLLTPTEQQTLNVNWVRGVGYFLMLEA